MESLPRDQWLLPTIVAYRAQQTPTKTYIILPKGDRLEDGFYELSYAEFARAVDRMAWWLDENLGRSAASEGPLELPTVPYIGLDDFRYHLAAIKTRRKALLPFPANTPASIVNLLKTTSSTVVLATASHMRIWEEPLKQYTATAVEVPNLDHFLSDEPVEHYKYVQTLRECYDEPAYVIQTSGTTGQAKTINNTNGFLADYIFAPALESRNAQSKDKEAVYGTLEGLMCPILLPLSWAAALFAACYSPFCIDQIPILLPHATAQMPPTPQYIVDVTANLPESAIRKKGIMLTPDILRQLLRDAKGRECLSRFAMVSYAGAPLDHQTGDAITDMGVRVQSFIGSTDIGIYPIRLSDPSDWKVHRFVPGYHGFEMEHFVDDLYELVVKKQGNDPRYGFLINSGMDVFRTRDLWRQVCGREGYWTNAGRVDDFIKLASMTKFNAITIEQIIEADPRVAKCIVAGDARARPFVLVQPKVSCGGVDALSEVLPAVEAANKSLLPEAHFKKDLVLITAPDKPILVTAKGTASRRATLDMYEQEISALYAKAGFETIPFKANGETLP
ncbi:hypothetical protein LTR62_001486 [Meristemomyces frigidus]|uniref:AMP-dependent synthetase/ligase domain-containing protein n=1 Tax=Meristemomyces frigidus TaxID=1508187 RepID=A0AAN7TGI3_9PEZI|nr:hypothetical protein LTR62_001486 [Meristemomyces frigidus]